MSEPNPEAQPQIVWRDMFGIVYTRAELAAAEKWIKEEGWRD